MKGKRRRREREEGREGEREEGEGGRREEGGKKILTSKLSNSALLIPGAESQGDVIES